MKMTVNLITCYHFTFFVFLFLTAKEKADHVFTVWRLQEEDARRSKEANRRYALGITL